MHLRFIVVRALDLITIIVPPALPATLTIGTSFALSRLRKRGIFCISPNRVNVSGTVDIMCFDKTGTLTEEGLDVLGARPVNRDINRYHFLFRLHRFSSLIKDPEALQEQILYTMTTCHSLKLVSDEIIGDPLDAKMFEFTRWTFEEGGRVYEYKDNGYVAREIEGAKTCVLPPNGSFELQLLKIFEFESAKRRMSVVVQKTGMKEHQVYVKGAPEIMPDICRADTFPDDYDEILEFYTHHGYRVIALASKTLQKRVKKLKREEAESELTFQGFIVFENKLKPTTAGVLEKLKNARIRRVMCTGDNILTAISVARECELAVKDGYVFVPHFIEGTNPGETYAGDSTAQDSELAWTCVQDPRLSLNPHSLVPYPIPQEVLPEFPSHNAYGIMEYSLAVSGDVFRWIVDFASVDVLERVDLVRMLT